MLPYPSCVRKTKYFFNKRLSKCCFKSRGVDDDDDSRNDDLSSTDVLCLLEKHLINFELLKDDDKVRTSEQQHNKERRQERNQRTIDDIEDLFESEENIFKLSIKEESGTDFEKSLVKSASYTTTYSMYSTTNSSPSIEVNEPVPKKSP